MQYIHKCLTCKMEFSTFDEKKIFCDKICAKYRITFLGNVVLKKDESLSPSATWMDKQLML
jgi:hypothetical protein